MLTIRLRRGADRRVRSGHLWVYSNEVDPVPPGVLPGDVVRVADARGAFVAYAGWNPHTLIAGRILSRREGEVPDRAWLGSRLRRAEVLRERVVPSRGARRWVHGEADGLPGLVIDRYGPLVVLQPHSAWADRVVPDVLEVLTGWPGVTAALVRADASSRVLEGLDPKVEVGFGEIPDPCEAREAGLVFRFSPWTGQKTGLFLDMRDNRDRCAPWFAGRSVLDLFAYVGQWGVRAAAAGASRVLCVDSSAEACGLARENAARNGFAGRVEVREADVLDLLRDQPRGSWDVVVCDPPAFVKSRKHFEDGLARYHRLNQLAARAVADDGLLVTASCSRNLPEEALVDVAATAAARQGREAVLIGRGGQAACHPVLPRHPESAYLKCLVFSLRGAGA